MVAVDWAVPKAQFNAGAAAAAPQGEHCLAVLLHTSYITLLMRLESANYFTVRVL